MRIEDVERARAGDHAAWSALAAATVDRLYAAARLIVGDPDGAEEAVQETLVRAWRYLPTLRDASRFEPWLHRLLVRACADESARSRRWTRQLARLDIEPVDRSDQMQRLADRDELERGFAQLSIDHRAVLVLHHLLGFTSVEIAKILGVPPGTVKSRIHYATDALRAAIEADARRSPGSMKERPA